MIVKIIYRLVFFSLLATIPLSVNAIPIRAESLITQYSSNVDLTSMAVKFDLRFKNAPDFFTTDSFGRQADAFQFFVNSDALPVDQSVFYQVARGVINRNDLTIIRGSEINVSNKIRVREVVENYDTATDTSSGGWGPTTGAELFVLNDTLLTFILPLSFLKDSDGLFYYYLETYSFGSTVGNTLFGISDHTFNVVSSIPEPSGITLMVFGLIGLLFMEGRKNYRL
jgi:hypothetical protein